MRAHGLTLSTGRRIGIKADVIRECMLSLKFSSKVVYTQLITCRYKKKPFSAIEKFARRGISVNRMQIVAGMSRCHDAVTPHRSLKCSEEICLAAMRSEYHVAVYEDRPRLACAMCNFPETISHIYKHLLTDCVWAKYLWPNVYCFILITTGKRVAITNELIFFGQLQTQEYKILSKINVRDIQSIAACCRLTLWTLYYKHRFISWREMIQCFNKNIFIMQKVAAYRGVKSQLHNIRPEFEDCTTTSYNQLIIQQREKTRQFLNEIQIARNQSMGGPHDVFLETSLDDHQEDSHLVGDDILKDIFFTHPSIFKEKNRFISSARVYAGLAQQKISDKIAINLLIRFRGK